MMTQRELFLLFLSCSSFAIADNNSHLESFLSATADRLRLKNSLLVWTRGEEEGGGGATNSSNTSRINFASDLVQFAADSFAALRPVAFMEQQDGGNCQNNDTCGDLLAVAATDTDLDAVVFFPVDHLKGDASAAAAVEGYCRQTLLPLLPLSAALHILCPKECDAFVFGEDLRLDSLLFYYQLQV